jgi:hypothetical protein
MLVRPSRYLARSTTLLVVSVSLLIVSGAIAQAADPKPGPWVGLGGGEMGEYEWLAEVHRPGGPAGAGSSGADRPCLSVTATWRVSRFDYRRSKYRQCAGTSGRLTVSDGPLIASAGQPSDGREPKMTAVGMIFPSVARRVQITVAGGRRTTLSLQKLTPDQAHAARLAPLRYAAFVVRGAWCAERLVSMNAAGKPLWDSGVDEYTCGAVSQPLP